jgi:hypothetical protein
MSLTKQTKKGVSEMKLDIKKVTGKIKQSQFNEYQVINEGMKKAYGQEMYDLSGATIDLGSIVEQFNVKVAEELNKLEDNPKAELDMSKGEEQLFHLINNHGTQFPMELNGQEVVIRINGAVSK